MATCYARPAAGKHNLDIEYLLDCYRKAYENEPFVVVCEESPAAKAVQHSNEEHLTARYDSRTGYMIVLCTIDNLGKGAAGQAIQCANLICNFPEETGLTSD